MFKPDNSLNFLNKLLFYGHFTYIFNKNNIVSRLLFTTWKQTLKIPQLRANRILFII